MGFRVLEHVIIDVQLVGEEIDQKHNAHNQRYPFVSALSLFLEVKPLKHQSNRHVHQRYFMNFMKGDVSLANMWMGVVFAVDTFRKNQQNYPHRPNQYNLHVQVEGEECRKPCPLESPVSRHTHRSLLKD